MSSFLCFICHNAVNLDTTEETREKYKELIDMNLCPDSQLCYICRHMINKLWLFKSICIKRSHEYPMFFNEKCTISLQMSNITTIKVCSEDCLSPNSSHLYLRYNNDNRDQSNDYVELQDEHNDLVDFIHDNTDIDYIPPIDGYDSKSDSIETNLHDVVNDNVSNVNDNEYNVNDNESDHYDNEDFNEQNVQNNMDYKVDDPNNVDNLDINYQFNDEGTIEQATIETEDKNIVNDYERILLSIEEQKAELEAQRRSKKYTDAEFKCYNCASGFLFKDSYQAHMMRHEESNGEYVCVLCTLRFASTAVLRSHRAVHRERYICCRCGVQVRKRQRDTHARKCHKKEEDSAACHLCGNVFQNASGLQQHLRRFHMSKTSNRTYACNVCGKRYHNQAAVRTHMIKHIQRKFKCEQCLTDFSSPYTLAQHKKKHTNTTNSQTHVCTTCGVWYTSRKSLLAHLRTALQHQETVYDCPICSRICPNTTALTAHIARIHSSTKDFACSSCDRRFSTKKSLLRHIREHSSRAKPKQVQCHMCGKNFKGNSKLNRHLREVCEKEKLEEELSAYQQHNTMF